MSALQAKEAWRGFWVCVSVASITVLDLSKVNVAIPSIQAALGAGSTELQLVVSGYLLTFGLFLVPMGRLGDQRSRRLLFIVGLTVFTLASALCAAAPNATVLIIGRLLQGAAAGTQMPQVMGLIQQFFPGPERARALGLYGALMGVSTALGPAIGGILVDLGGPVNGWRWIFWMNLPLGVIAISLAIWLLPPSGKTVRSPVALDPVGLVLFAVAVVCLMTPFLLTTGSPDDNPHRWWLLLIFALLIGLLVIWERRYSSRGKHPLIPPALFRIASYRSGTIVQTLYFIGLPSLLLLTMVFLQEGVGFTAFRAGTVATGFAVTSAVFSWVGGTLVNRIGRHVVTLGLALMIATIGLLWLAVFNVSDDIVGWFIAAIMVFGGIGSGLVIAPNQVLQLADVPIRGAGLAGSVGQLGQRIGTAVGTAVGVALFYSAVFEADGNGGAATAYHFAYAYALVAVALAFFLALLAGLLDGGGRRTRVEEMHTE